jgi:hypothetical protein
MVGKGRIGGGYHDQWNPGENGAPKDRRLLLIATPRKIPEPNLKADLVVGHWNESVWAFVPLEIPYPRGPTRPELNVEWWAEIPALPLGVELRDLTLEDVKG